MSDVINKAWLVNAQLKSNKKLATETVPAVMRLGIESARGDQGLNRAYASAMSPITEQLTVQKWSEGMFTHPGDLVYDPEGRYVYMYSGETAMRHTNPLFYPGAVGVYHWAVVPRMKDGIKVYPDVDGIIVAVKNGEQWWDTTEENVFEWVSADNRNCVWPPMDGNEWERIENPTLV